MNALNFTTDTGVPMTLADGDNRGLHGKLGRIVSFWDRRYPHKSIPGTDEMGQFISAYYVDTMLEHEHGRGLDLDGGVPSWSVDADTFERCHAHVACSLEEV